MIHLSRRLSSRIILFKVTIIFIICHSVWMMGPKTIMLTTADASNIENNNNNNPSNGDHVVEKSNDHAVKTTSASNQFTINHGFYVSPPSSTTGDGLSFSETVTSTDSSNLEFEDQSNDLSEMNENDWTEDDNEIYRRLFEQLLAHPDVVLASDTFPFHSSVGLFGSEESKKPATSGKLDADADDDDTSKEILYHIIIANSTSTTLPVIMVTTNSDGSQTALHRLNLTQSPSTKSPIMYSDWPTILTTKSPQILGKHNRNPETDMAGISSGSDHSAEMIVLEAHQSIKQTSSQLHDEDSSLKFEKIASPEFLELLKSIYQEPTDNNTGNKLNTHHSYHAHSHHKHRHKSQEPMKMFVTSSSSSLMGGASSSDKPSLANHPLQFVEADVLGSGDFVDGKFELEKNSFTSNEIDPSNFDDDDDDDDDDDHVDNVNVQEQENSYQLRNVIVVIAYSLIMIVSMFGNYLVCHVIYSTPKLRTTTNILIFSLTISDILTTILNIPFNCARFLIKDWPFPDSFCVLMPTVQVASVYVSSLTMAAICLHRYRSILGNSTPNIVISTRLGLNQTTCSMSRIKIKMWILFIWLLSILLALPHSLFNVVVWIQQPNGQLIRRCRAHYPKSIEKQMPLFLSLLATVTQFLLPLGLTTALYIRIGRIIAHQGKLAKHYCDELNRRVMEAKRKRITMLVLIVVGFLITWFPLTLYHLLIDFHLIHFDWNQFLVLHIWAMTSVCYNPFIYCFMNEDFRKRSRQLMQRRTFPLYFCLTFNKSRLDTRIGRGGGHVSDGTNGTGESVGNGRYVANGGDDYDYGDDDDDDDADGTSLNQGGATNQSSSSTIMSNGRMYRAQYHHQYKNQNHSIKSNQLFHHHLKNNNNNNMRNNKKKKNGCAGSSNFLMELLGDRRNLPLRRSTSTSGSISLQTLKNTTASTLNMITANSSNNVDDANNNGNNNDNTYLERFIKYGSHQQLLAPATPSLSASITKPMPNTSSTITLEMESQQNLNSMNDEEGADNFDSKKSSDTQHIRTNDDDDLNLTETNAVSANGAVNFGNAMEN